MRILLVDDDQPLTEILRQSLVEQHYAVDTATDGEAGWEYVSVFDYDLILLDVMLPKLDGISLCQRLRSHGYQMPILLLTARDKSPDKIKGLDAGADDYVVKPVNLEELAARIRALLRRDSQSLPTILQWGRLSLNPSICKVIYGDYPLQLTPKEYALLELFLRSPNRVFSLGAIIDNVWSAEDSPGEDTVRTHIKGLRRKLRSVDAPPDLIETVYGLGYRLKSQPTEPIPPTSAPPASLQTGKQTKALAAIAGAWEQYKGQIMGRLGVLEQTLAVLPVGALNDERQQQAQQAVHSLVGTLGTFGLAEGSRLAQRLEHLLQEITPLEPAQVKLFELLVAALRREIEATPTGQFLESTQMEPLRLLVVHDPTLLTQPQAAAHSLHTEFAPTLSQAREFIDRQPLDAVLIKICFSNPASDALISQSEGLAFIEELAYQTPSLLVLAVTDSDRLTDRIEVLRRGAHACLPQPVTPSQIVASVAQTGGKSNPGAKVMIVDDDPQLLGTLQILLAPWDFKLTTLEDPHQFWDVLKRVEPDLLVLDVEMPDVNGLELCQLLRSDPHWSQLPVLFLTAHTDAKTQHQVFAIGADDYMSKPVVAAELATRVLNRLERVQSLRG
ncbi:MAG: response regulator [Pseudanabaenales cyanobacterium]|nr:response regulator [Pseudanabaenales cyanobacterium]